MYLKTMGIKNLLPFLRKHAPSGIATITLDHFRGDTFAIDTSCFLYRFISQQNKLQGNWIDGFIRLYDRLRRYSIEPVFVFDGTPPKEKTETRKQRRSTRDKTKEKIARIETLMEEISALDAYASIQEYVDQLACFIDIDPYTTKYMCLQQLNRMHTKLRGSCIDVTHKHIQQLKELFDCSGIRYIQAPDEAERYCAALSRYNCVDAVVTIDSDILAYNTRIFINGIDLNKDSVEVFCIKDILEALQWTYPQFRDFCILCGTDYNTNIPKVGVKTSYQLIDRYIRIEDIPVVYDTSILRYTRVRELFNVDSLYDHITEQMELHQACNTQQGNIQSSGDQSKLFLFLQYINSEFNTDFVLKERPHPRFIIENDTP